MKEFKRCRATNNQCMEKEEAERSAAKFPVSKTSTTKMVAYKCPYCPSWHIEFQR